MNAQGEDVVAGVRTPHHLAKSRGRGGLARGADAARPDAELLKVVEKLEKHYRDMLDIEFTIQNDRLWMLQVPLR